MGRGNVLTQLPERCGLAEAVNHEIGAHGGKRAQSGVESLVVPVTTATLPFNMK